MGLYETREQWGSKGHGGYQISRVSELIAHHFFRPHVSASVSVEDERRVMQSVEKYHVDQFYGGNYSSGGGTGYQFVVFQSGRAYEGRGWHRSGAHCKGRNSKSVGFAFAINGDSYTPTEKAWETARKIAAEGIQVGAITSDYTLSGHTDYCVDDQTEILTADGWMPHHGLSVGDEVLTMNPDTGKSEWQVVQDIYRNHRTGKMIQMQGRALSALVTPDHRWIVRSRSGSKGTWGWSFRTTTDLGIGLIPRAVEHDNPNELAKFSDEFVELVAWYWTEGSVKFNQSGIANQGELSQSLSVNPDYVERIRQCLASCFGSEATPSKPGGNPARDDGLWFERNPRDNGVIVWSLRSGAVRQLEAIARGKDKVVDPEFLRALTPSQIDLFVSTSVDADGYRKDDEGGFAITQKSEDRIRSFEMACVLAGLPVRTKREGPKWSLRSAGMHRFFSPGSMTSRKHEVMQEVDYDGTIWCPTTPNGTWLARRKGSVYWTGNSSYKSCPGDKTYPIIGEHLSSSLVAGYQPADDGTEEAPMPLPEWARYAWEWAKSKGLANDKTDPNDLVDKKELMAILHRYHERADKTGGDADLSGYIKRGERVTLR